MMGLDWPVATETFSTVCVKLSWFVCSRLSAAVGEVMAKLGGADQAR